jgi:hypothetical protein
MTKAVLITVVLLASVLMFAVMILLIRLRTGRPFRSILAECDTLFLHSFILAIILLVLAAVTLTLHNN